MVQIFKLRPGRYPVFRVEPGEVEQRIGRQSPWFVPGSSDRHFAVCPYCDNPIQLKALYNRTERSPAPYGSHVRRSLPGFVFCEQSLDRCPHVSKSRSHASSKAGGLDEMAEELIDLAITEFDRIVLILRDDLGFRFSDAFALRMLERWLSSEGYAYEGAHLRNLPWMILYFGGSANLYGQPIQTNGGLADAIVGSVPFAMFDKAKRLKGEGGYFRVELQALNHNVVVEEDEVFESLEVRVVDYTDRKSADDSNEVFRFKIDFTPDRFEGLIHTPAGRAKRNQRLLDLATSLVAD